MKRALATMAVVLAVTTVAEAYAPPAPYILGLVAQKRQKQKLEALRAWFKRTELVNGQPAGEPVEEVITFRSGGRWRREWTDATGKHAYVADPARALSVEGDKRTKVEPEADLLASLWAMGADADEREAAQARAVALLAAWGVGENVAYSRADGRIAWVLGGTAAGTAQIWVDKDDYLLMRAVYPVGPRTDAGPSGPWVDVRYRSWGSTAGGEFFPARIETWRDGVLVRVEELQKVDVTPKIDEKDFKLE
ncbi:MAG: hypothetical protein HY904_23920 [Deltaproteobacteria bacterium]|nr:hypothetical protein [Deltaproteobacteria bacterium]